MRNRGDAGPKVAGQRTTATSATAAAATARARAASKRSSSTRQSRRRGFWIGTGCFLICLLFYLCFRQFSSSATSVGGTPRKAKAGLRVAERDVVALGIATRQVAEQATLPGFDELSRTAAQIGAVFLTLLEQVAAAQELEDGGHALRQLDVSQHYLSSVADALRYAADVSYSKLKRMLLREPDAELANAPTSLVRTTYGWMLSDLFLYSAVLPEYYLLKDDTASHALMLLRSLHLLSWSSTVRTVPSQALADATQTSYDIFNWSGGAACRKSPHGAVSEKWMQFCKSSFSSAAAVARRAAATYEELIVLYPTYAPLRLHYAIAFTFLKPSNAAHLLSEHAMKALRVLRSDREKLGVRYKPADGVHAPLLTLLEAYLTPADLWTSEQQTQLVRALGELKGCDDVRVSLLTKSRWRENGGFEKEYRAPLLTAEQLSALLAKAQLHLGADHAVLAPFLECL